MAEHWDELTAEAREDRREIISDLRRQRNDLAEWYGVMKHGTAESWDDAKQGFVSVYNKLGESYDAVVDQFTANKTE